MRRIISSMLALILIALMLPVSSLAACSHPYWYLDTKVKGTGYICDDADGHYCCAQVTTWCTYCGKIIEQYGDGGEWHPHSFNANGKCTKCGYNRTTGKVEGETYNWENNQRQKKAVEAGSAAIGHTGTIVKNGNVRSQPNKESRIVGSVKTNQTYEILNCKLVNGNRIWYKIQMKNGNYGWVSAMLMEVYDVIDYDY